MQNKNQTPVELPNADGYSPIPQHYLSPNRGPHRWIDQILNQGFEMVQDQLKHVQHIVATRYAFAAVLADGSVVTSGYAAFGGDSTSVRDEFKYL